MLFFWTKRKLLRREVSNEERNLLDSSLWQARYLSRDQRERLIRWIRVFIYQKNWEGCNGLQITEPMQWTVAAAAGLMMLKYPEWYYNKSKSILIYPEAYVAQVQTSFGNSADVILGGEYYRAGETIYRGPIVLNWRDLDEARKSANGGHHLAIHEFAHQIDMINGPIVDGLPPLPQGVHESSWIASFRAEFQEARKMVEQGFRIRMDDYGLTQESEFFAVASELYFQVPAELAEFHPNLFQLLKQFYMLELPY